MRRAVVIACLVLVAGLVAVSIRRLFFNHMAKNVGATPADVFLTDNKLAIPQQRNLTNAPEQNIGPNIKTAFLPLTEEERKEASAQSEAYEKSRDTLSKERLEKLRRLMRFTKSVKFTRDGQTFEWMAAMAAIPSKDFKPGMGEEVEKNLQFTFFKYPGSTLPEGSKGVVLNPSTESLAVVTGAISIKLRDINSATQLAHDYGLELIQAFPEIQVFYFRTAKKNIPELVDKLEALRKDTRVERANLDVLDRIYAAN